MSFIFLWPLSFFPFQYTYVFPHFYYVEELHARHNWQYQEDKDNRSEKEGELVCLKARYAENMDEEYQCEESYGKEVKPQLPSLVVIPESVEHKCLMLPSFI
jgi:hypothetical protein